MPPIKNAVLIIAGVIAGLGLGEILFSRFTSNLFYRINVQSEIGGRFSLCDNERLIYVPVPGTGAFNSYGHRGETFSFSKTGRKRAVFMGDSVVEGLRMGVRQRFTELLSGMLGDRYEIVNLGVCGYSFLQEFEYLKKEGLKFSPDYVWWGITYNDLGLDSSQLREISGRLKSVPKNGFYHDYFTLRRGLMELLPRSSIYTYFKYVYSSRAGKDFEESVKYTLSPVQLDDLLGQITSLARTRNFKLVFVFLPVNTTEHQAAIDAFKESVLKARIPFIDIDAAMNAGRGTSEKELFFPGDPCHLNAKGHAAVAAFLYDHRQSLGLEQ